MKTQIFTDARCFDVLHNEWHDLLSRAAVNHIFMTPEFQKSWWETLGEGELCVITFHDESGKLIGLAPLFSFLNDEREKQISFIGCVNVSDYLDFIVDRDSIQKVYAALANFLTNANWQKLFLCSIPAASPTRTLLPQFFQPHHWQTSEQQQDVCPAMNLPKNWEEYLDNIGKKQRHEIKRKWQKLERETNAQFEVITSPHDLQLSITKFIELHQKSSTDKKSFWDEKHVEFFQVCAARLAEKGWLKLYFLKIEDQRVATMLAFIYNNQFFLYNSGFDAEEYRALSVGNVLTAYTIQDAIRSGNTHYDFLRGNEEYKFRFGAVSEPIYDLTVRKMG